MWSGLPESSYMEQTSHLGWVCPQHPALSCLWSFPVPVRSRLSAATISSPGGKGQHPFSPGPFDVAAESGLELVRCCFRAQPGPRGQLNAGTSKVVNPTAVRLKLPRSLRMHPTFHVARIKPVMESSQVPAPLSNCVMLLCNSEVSLELSILITILRSLYNVGKCVWMTGRVKSSELDFRVISYYTCHWRFQIILWI